MKKFRTFLSLALVLICATMMSATRKAATVTINKTTMNPNTTNHWYVSGTGVGWQCTKGNYQSKNINKQYLMAKATALYKPYVTNYSVVTMTVSAGGTFTLQ